MYKSDLKIAVHITHHITGNPKEMIKKDILLKKVINSYLSLSKSVNIFVHLNKKMQLKYKTAKVNCIVYKLKKEHPFYLSWKCRRIMEKQKNNYDVFVYTENDILFKKNNFNYWLQNKDICKNNNYNLGFIRVEDNKKKGIYAIDIFLKLKKFISINNRKFIINDNNSYCAFWIYDNEEFNKFIRSNVWKFKWKTRFQHYGDIRAMSAIGWHGRFMGRYKETLIPLKNNRIDINSIVYHLENKYSITNHGPGSLKIKEILNKELIKVDFIYPLKIFMRKIYKKIIN